MHSFLQKYLKQISDEREESQLFPEISVFVSSARPAPAVFLPGSCDKVIEVSHGPSFRSLLQTNEEFCTFYRD